MSESRSVTLSVNLPRELADELEHLQRTDPEFIERVLTYGLVRRAVFSRLKGVTPLWQASPPSVNVSLQPSLETS